MGLKNFIKIIFRGISQVFLVNNAFTGMVFLAGVIYNSWLMGVGAITGALIGTLTAMLLKYNKNDIDQGLYGYNSALVSLAIIYFFGFNIPSSTALFFGSILSAALMRVMSAWRLPPFTAPFIISTWTVMLFLIKFPILPLKTAPLPDAVNLEALHAVTRGLGQVMFQESAVAGMVFFIGLLVSSRICALYGLLGSALGVAVAFASSLPVNMIHAGLFGFNGALCGIAFSNKKWSSLIPAIASVIISIFVAYEIMHSGIISLTSPFVISTWIVLLFKNKIRPIFYRRFEEMKTL